MGNSEFCFPSNSMFPSASPRGNKTHCFPRDQSLSAYYAMLYKNSERMRDFLGLFIFIVVLVFYILGTILLKLIKQLFHSRLLDIYHLISNKREWNNC